MVFFHTDIRASWCGSKYLTLPLASLQFCLPWFYSAPLSLTAGFDPDRCGTASTSFFFFTEEPRIYWEKWWSRLPDVFDSCCLTLDTCSQIRLLKSGLPFFFLLSKLWLKGSWQGARELSCPGKKKRKHQVFLLSALLDSRSQPVFGCYLALHKAGQRRERQGYQANEKQLGQVPSLNQACKLNKAHAIDFRVIHYLLWM